MSANKSWIVTLKCEVKKSVVVENCTKEQAESKPWEHAVDETEIEMTDWEVLKVEPNE